MSQFSLCRVALAALLAVGSEGEGAFSPRDSIDLDVTEIRLLNGLTVILHEDHRAPRVSVDVHYRVGSSDDPPGRSGFAHLFEHLMLQGSKHVPEDMAFRYLEQAGATLRNANTGEDVTYYYETVPSHELELALWIESDRMGFLLDHLNEQTFSNQRDVVKAELRRSIESQPYGWEMRILLEHVYPPSHPYHRITIGTLADLDAATVQEVRTFFRTWYRPNNAVLTIAGDFVSGRAKALVDQYFGPIPARPVPLRSEPDPVLLKGETLVDVAADVELPRLLIAWPTPRSWSAADANLQFVGKLLGEGEASRLHRRLVGEAKIAQSVEAWQGCNRLSSTFVVTATPRAGHSVDELLPIIDEELARLKQEGPSDAELARMQGETRSWFVFQAEGSRLGFADYRLFKGMADYLPEDMARFERTTLESVRRSASRWLPKNARVVERITPVKGAPIAGEVRKVSIRGATP
jgi:predicted Zn-dependent peptidase